MGRKILDYEAKDIMNEDGILSVADAASRADLTEDVFNAKMQAYKGE